MKQYDLVRNLHWLFKDVPEITIKVPQEAKTILISVISSVTSAVVLWYILQLKPPWVSARLARKYGKS